MAVAMIGGLSLSFASPPPNMNGPYLLANSQTHVSHATFAGGSEYFDVYSPPITTLYSQVYWTLLPSVALPPAIVARFANKSMAITGWEADQVLKGEGPNGTDLSVPITWSYDHHHCGHINGKAAKLVRITPEDPRWADEVGEYGHEGAAGEAWIAVQTGPTATGTPATARLTNGNGGEYRKSFHGFAKGYAQLVDSPETFDLQVMQIDTWNREHMKSTTDPFVPGPIPTGNSRTGLAHRVGSLAPLTGPDAIYSGLLECPCTDRITKVLSGGAGASARRAIAQCAAGAAGGAPWNAKACFAAIPTEFNHGAGGGGFDGLNSSVTVSSSTLPPGCSYSYGNPVVHGKAHWNAVWNTNTASVAPCGGGGGASSSAAASKPLSLWGNEKFTDTGVEVRLETFASNGTILITLTGPSEVWFGVGFNASVMKDQPYTLIIDGKTGEVTERQLADQAPGTLLTPPSVVVVSNVVNAHAKTRTVELTGLVHGAHFTFDDRQLALPIITAIGSGPAFSYHKAKVNGVLRFQIVDQDVPMCVCPPQAAAFGTQMGKLVYNAGVGNASAGVNGSVAFKKHCAMTSPTTTNDMIKDKNSECDIRTYIGGQSCCHHLWSLLNVNQTIPWRDQPLIMHHKWRIWFQDYIPSAAAAAAAAAPDAASLVEEKESEVVKVATTTTTAASHVQGVRFAWGGMATPTEYEVPQCKKGTPTEECSHVIHGTFAVKDIQCREPAPECALWKGNKATGIGFLKINAHCHAPTCIEMTLWNADTDEIVCKQVGAYGGESMPTINGTRFNEEGYIAVPPCVWGSDDAMGVKPLVLSMGTNLRAESRTNNTYGHHGEMAIWQIFGVVEM